MSREPYEPPRAEDEPSAIPAPSDEIVALRVVGVTVLVLATAVLVATRGLWLDILPEPARLIVTVVAASVAICLTVWLRRGRGISLGARRGPRPRRRNRRRT
jgi:hypothetical protein